MIGAVAGLLALHVLALYVLYRATLFICAFVPMIGRRHRYADWKAGQKK